jgi:hypothetical protein
VSTASHPLRALLDQLDPNDPARALRVGRYVAPPRGVSGATLARHFGLDPVARLLLLGAIGVGKSTALLVAADALSSDGVAVVQYVDAPLYQSMEVPRPGLLLRLAGLLTLRHRMASGPLNAVTRVDVAVLHAGLSPDPKADLVDPTFLETAGELPSPDIRELEAIVERLGAGVPGWSARPRVLLIDGIDLTDEGASLDALVDDLDALRRLGFGVCIVGSIGWRYTLSPALLERFDRLLSWTPPTPEVDAADHAFLRAVLERRVGASTLAPAVVEQIVMTSGGVMRDLLALARRAVIEAHLDSRLSVEPEHVVRAVAELGYERQLSLNAAALEVARRFLDDSTPARGDHVADLLRRAILLPIDANQQRFRVHPALAPFLRAREAA